MKRPDRWIPLLALLAATITWLATSELPTPARVLTVVLVGVLPPLLLVQASIADDDFSDLPIVPVYWSSMLVIWAIGAAAVWAGTSSGIQREAMGLRSLDAAQLLLWTGFITLAAVGVLVLGRALGWRETPLLQRLLPRTTGERMLFIALSLSAGIGEELAYRGFLIPALRHASGSTAIAVIVSSIAFGMMHSYQRTSGALRASALGALLAAPVLVTGSIYPSMAAHAAFDVIAGLVLADWLMRPRDGGRPSGRKH